LRADRLLSILLLLQSRGKMTSRVLAQTLETSERTVFRDMEALSAAGIPVYSERGPQGGWMLSEGYRTALTGMKPKEVISLLLSANSTLLKDLGIHEDFTAATRKLETVSSRNSTSIFSERIHVDTEDWISSEETFPYLLTLQTALWEDRKVNITYLRNDEEKNRRIGLLGLVAKRGVWYVIGQHEDQLRTYRVSRIVAAEITEEEFIRPDDFELSSYWELSKASFKSAIPSYQAKFSIKASTLQDLRQERFVTLLSIDKSPISEWLEVEAEFNTIQAACRIMLSLGPNVIVNFPEDLRMKVYQSALDIVRLGCGVRRDFTDSI